MITCRICNSSSLAKVVDLGSIPLANELRETQQEGMSLKKYPLELFFCKECSLIQTKDFIDYKEIFGDSYPYLSSASNYWTSHLVKLLNSITENFLRDSTFQVAEIASNDGCFIELATNAGIKIFGIEPTPIPATLSIGKGHNVHNLFLTEQTADEIVAIEGLSDVVFAANVFAHVPNLNSFCKAASKLLKPSGTIIIEVQYLGTIIRSGLFDTVYHEHFSYFSLKSMARLLERNKLKVYRAELIEVHGGSLRVYATHDESSISIEENVQDLLREEERAKLGDELTYHLFQKRIEERRKEIIDFVYGCNLRGMKIAAYGAAAKGNTVLNYCNLDFRSIPFIVDAASSKWGRFLPGSGVPIFPVDELRNKEIDLMLIFPWNISSEIRNVIRSFSNLKKCDLYSLMPEIGKLD